MVPIRSKELGNQGFSSHPCRHALAGASADAIWHVGKDGRWPGHEVVMEHSSLIDDGTKIIGYLVIRWFATTVVKYGPKFDVNDERMGIASAKTTQETTEALFLLGKRKDYMESHIVSQERE